MSAFQTPDNSPPTKDAANTDTFRIEDEHRAICFIREPPISENGEEVAPARWGLAISRYPANGKEYPSSALPYDGDHKWQVYQWHPEWQVAIFRPRARYYGTTRAAIQEGDVTLGLKAPKDVTTNVIRDEWEAELKRGPKHTGPIPEQPSQIHDKYWVGDEGLKEHVIHAALDSGDTDNLTSDWKFVIDMFERMCKVENMDGDKFLPYRPKQFEKWEKTTRSHYPESRLPRTGTVVVQGEWLPGQDPNQANQA